MITDTPQWARLAELASAGTTDLREAFAGDPGRAERFTFEAAGLVADLSKHLIDDEVMTSLLELAVAAGLPERIEAMFEGEPINSTEGRAVLHTAFARRRRRRVHRRRP